MKKFVIKFSVKTFYEIEVNAMHDYTAINKVESKKIDFRNANAIGNDTSYYVYGCAEVE